MEKDIKQHSKKKKRIEAKIFSHMYELNDFVEAHSPMNIYNIQADYSRTYYLQYILFYSKL